MLDHFLWGGSAVASAAVALFFFKFQRETRDRLFLAFGLAFSLLALNWAVLSLAHLPDERRPFLYLLRLGAFLLIAWAVLEKNRSASPPSGRPRQRTREGEPSAHQGPVTK